MSIPGRVLITGAAGQLGRELQRTFSDFGEIVAVDRESVDLAVPEQIRSLVQQVKPSVILNAAAYTAVDRAESEREVAMAINAEAPRVLAEEARQKGALLVHYSTDYVFDGTKHGPSTEGDPTNPLSVYGASKLAGEQAVQQVGGPSLIFRTSWVYGPHGKNFLLTMLRLASERESLSVVDDQLGAPTTSIALADATRTIVEGISERRFGTPGSWAGLYHMTCGGSTTWHGFAEAIFARSGALLDGKRPEVKPIGSGEYPAPAKRPQNSVMSNARLKERFGITLPMWEQALDVVLERLKAK
ncbi:MAG TPA: dTDP-4-dehydrorhamnose reductase [Acidobacteriaceae bacterium]